eukprot:gnl/MRDRNA2_/MRDRNA2_205839_c0_seq1.p1 gnl/MRDRNA2_/MRDRNA2_205839_c0~~gnl/MRDRNA2_/MRDRNA2_205839_c0_seq1.p1  ORF type:complete len:205 (-),score=44.04 gnl/MRDRNA2_/MRDRNA2_205839_c0_seq1:106-720(-)
MEEEVPDFGEEDEGELSTQNVQEVKQEPDSPGHDSGTEQRESPEPDTKVKRSRHMSPSSAERARPDLRIPATEALPSDYDSTEWVELLRDTYYRKLRSDQGLKEPPPFYEAMDCAVESGEKFRKGKLPRAGLNTQLQMLLHARGDFETQKRMAGNGVRGKDKGSSSHSITHRDNSNASNHHPANVDLRLGGTRGILGIDSSSQK